MKTGIVVIGHGCRASVGEANQVVFAIAGMVKERMQAELVEPAFMNPKSQLQDLATSVGKLVRQGARRVVVVPMFIARGMHLREDIPAEVAKLREIYRDIDIVMAPHIGTDPRIADILVDRIREVQ